MSALVSCLDVAFLPQGFDAGLGFLPQGFDVGLDGFDVGLGGEVLFQQLGLLPHDGLGLAFGHAGAHQLVDRRMCVKNQWCHG